MWVICCDLGVFSLGVNDPLASHHFTHTLTSMGGPMKPKKELYAPWHRAKYTADPKMIQFHQHNPSRAASTTPPC